RYRRGSAGGGAVVGGGGGRRRRQGRGQVAGGAGGGAPRQAVRVELRHLLAVDQLPGLGVAVARRLVEVVHGAVPVLGHTLALVVLDGEVELGVGGAVVGGLAPPVHRPLGAWRHTATIHVGVAEVELGVDVALAGGLVEPGGGGLVVFWGGGGALVVEHPQVELGLHVALLREFRPDAFRLAEIPLFVGRLAGGEGHRGGVGEGQGQGAESGEQQGGGQAATGAVAVGHGGRSFYRSSSRSRRPLPAGMRRRGWSGGGALAAMIAKAGWPCFSAGGRAR